MPPSIALIGDLCVDLLFSSKARPRYGQAEQYMDDYAIEIGGSAAIFAAQFTKLGGEALLAGRVGQDAFGLFVVEKLRSLGLSTGRIVQDPGAKTALGLGLFDGSDRAMFTYMGTLLGIGPEYLQPASLGLAPHWHIAGYFLLPRLWDHWPAFLREARQRGLTVSLDTNWPPEENWARVREILPLVDVFLPNEEEARQISGESSTESAGHWLSRHCKIVVIKCGAEGAKLFSEGRMEPYPVPEALMQGLAIADTTGAGDNFDAGFLYNWLTGKPLDACVDLGLRCGTASLRALGGIEGQLRGPSDSGGMAG